MSQESSQGQQSSESSNITSGGSSSSSANMVNSQIPPPDVARRNNSLPTKLDKEDDVHQVATLLALIGKHANKVFRTSTFSPPDDAEKIELVLSNSKSTAYPGRTPFMNTFFSLLGISVNPKLYIYIYWPVSYKTSSDRSKLWPWVNHIWLASPGSICDRHCQGTWKLANREEVDPRETIRKSSCCWEHSCTNDSVFGVWYYQRNNKKKFSMKVFVLSQKVGSKIIDFLVLVMRDAAALHLDRSVHIVKRKITLTPAKSKLSAFQERFY